MAQLESLSFAFTLISLLQQSCFQEYQTGAVDASPLHKNLYTDCLCCRQNPVPALDAHMHHCMPQRGSALLHSPCLKFRATTPEYSPTTQSHTISQAL